MKTIKAIIILTMVSIFTTTTYAAEVPSVFLYKYKEK